MPVVFHPLGDSTLYLPWRSPKMGGGCRSERIRAYDGFVRSKAVIFLTSLGMAYFRGPMDLRNTKTTIINQGDSIAKREEIRQYFHATYRLDEQLYDTLASETAFYLRPEPLRHPLIFYLGHTAASYINKLIVAKITTRRINPHFESMFAVGVDEMSWDDLNAAHYDCPSRWLETHKSSPGI